MRATMISKEEEKLVQETKEKLKTRENMPQSSSATDEEIRAEKRSKLLRKEILRLVNLKKDMLEQMDAEERKDPKAYLAREEREDLEQEVKDRQFMEENKYNQHPWLFEEIMYRGKMRSMPDKPNHRYVFAKPRCMRKLEQECPVLMDPARSYRQTLTRTILERENVNDVSMFIAMMEALEMIESGELTREQADMKLGKIMFERGQLVDSAAKCLTHKRMVLRNAAPTPKEKLEVDLRIKDEMFEVLTFSMQELRNLVKQPGAWWLSPQSWLAERNRRDFLGEEEPKTKEEEGEEEEQEEEEEGLTISSTGAAVVPPAPSSSSSFDPKPVKEPKHPDLDYRQYLVKLKEVEKIVAQARGAGPSR